MRPIIKIHLSLLSLALLFAMTAGNAWANVAANTQIINKATLTFTGGSAAASVIVTVALVPSTPNISITSGNTAYTAPNTPSLTDSVIITATANGPAQYTVTPTVTASTNVLASNPATVDIGGASSTSVQVGASVTTGTSGTTFVTVPAGGASGNNATVNGIGVNSTIVFIANGVTYTEQVTSTTDNGDGTFKLNWTAPIASAPIAGTLVAEQKTVNVTVLPGTVSATGAPITVTVQAQVTTTGAGAVTATTAPPNSWTTPSANILFTKYVRNVSTPVTGTGATSFTINTVTSAYYTGGVTGKPGDTLEYVLVATNNGAADLNGCAIADVLPTAYVKLASPGPYGGKDVFYIDSNGATYQITAAAVGANQASYVAPNLNVSVGIGANATTTGAIPAGKSVTVAYQVTIQ
jgi:hypothetical protein